MRDGPGRRIADHVKHIAMIITAILAATTAVVAAYDQIFGL